MIVDRPPSGRNPEHASENQIIALGSTGLVGSRVIELDSGIVIPRNRIDITDRDAVMRKLQEHSGGTLVNFAAYTNVGAAEKLRSKTDDPWRINVEGAENVAKACAEHGIHLIHISTDFVFRGAIDEKGPYTENALPVDSPEGITWYGWTKAVAEKKVAEALRDGKLSILRIAYPYRAHFADKGDFARGIQELHKKGTLYPMYTDQYITPTFIDEVAEAIRIIQETEATGIFHAASSNMTTPHDFASYLVGENVEGSSFPSDSPRPQYGGLSVIQTQEQLGIQFMTWQQGVDAMLEQQSS